MNRLTTTKTGSLSSFFRQNGLQKGRLTIFESGSWPVYRDWQSPRGLFARSGFRSPTKLCHKSGCPAPNRSTRDFIVQPPFVKFPFFRVDQICKWPQFSARRSKNFYSLRPDLNSSLRFDAVELPHRQSSLLFQRSDTVFLLARLCFSWKSVIFSRLSDNEDQPQLPLEKCSPVCLIFDQPGKWQQLIRQPSHSHIISTSDIKLCILSGLPFFPDIIGRKILIVIQLHHPPTNSRESRSAIFSSWHLEHSITSNSFKNVNIRLTNGLQKKLNSISRTNWQHLGWIPPSRPFFALLNLRRAMSDWTGQPISSGNDQTPSPVISRREAPPTLFAFCVINPKYNYLQHNEHYDDYELVAIAR